MSATNDGGPAFPSAENGDRLGQVFYRQGMTLRDYFAGQALAGYRASKHWECSDEENVVALAYIDADAMLAERAKAKEKAT